MIKRAILTLALVGTSTVASAEEPMELVCGGSGSANKVDQSTFQASNNYGDTANGTITGRRSQAFSDETRVRLNDDDPRIRMPRTMLPPIRGGDEGWFRLKNIEYTDSEIRASISVNPLNNPKLRIDRYTGAINISGKAGDYSGRCVKLDPEEHQRAF